MWNFNYGFNNFSALNNFNLFNNSFMSPSFFNFGFGMGQYYSPFSTMFNFSNPIYSPYFGSGFTYTPATSATRVSDPERINNISSNKDRIIEYNKTNYNKNYYGIVDKKNCKLTIYDKSGRAVKTYTLGLGKEKGDGLTKNHTTAGEFTLDENVKGKDADNYTSEDGTYKFMALRGDNAGSDNLTAGIHMVPKNLRSERNPKMESETIDDNRMSLGCINMTENDYDDMCKYLGEGCKLYVLPEEDGNELKLKEQSDGSYKFEQTYHQDDERAVSKEAASVVIYDA